MILSSGPLDSLSAASTSSPWATVVLVAAVAAYLLASIPSDRRWASTALVVGWLLHAVTVTFDSTAIDAHGSLSARFGFAPVLSATLWLVLAVYVIESRFVPLPGVRR